MKQDYIMKKPDNIELERHIKEFDNIASSVINSMHNGVIVLNKKFKFIVFNPAMELLAKTQKEKILNSDKKPWEFFPHLKEVGIDKIMKRAMKGEIIQNVEVPYNLPDGTHGYTSESFFPLKTSEGSINGIIGVISEITDRKSAEEKFRILAEKSPNMIFINLRGKVVYVNDMCVEVMGYAKEDYYAEDFNFLSLIAPESLELVKSLFKKHSEGEEVEPYEYKIKTKNGDILDVIITTKLIDYEGESAILGIVTDISERKKTEQELEKALIWHETVFNGSLDPIVITDSESRLVSVNDAACRSWGYSRNELLNMYIRDLHANVDLDAYNKFHERIWSGEEIVSEAKILRKDGKEIDTEFTNRLVYIDGTEFMNTIARDISEWKKTEKKLLQLFRAVEHSPVSVVITNKKGEIEYVNPKFLQSSGYTIKEVVDKKPNIMKSGRYSKDHYHNMWDTINSEKEWSGEILNKKKDGSLYWENLSISPILDDDGTITNFIGITEDISERKRSEEENKKLEEQLFHAQKMESIGRLAGGIAHDFNNILVSIVGFSDLLKMKFNDPSTSDGRAIDIIAKSADRAAKLVNQLLGFARGGKNIVTSININNLIVDSVKISEKIFKKKVKVIYELEENISIIEADDDQINQVLTNLIINANDAMPNGGELFFKTENCYLDKENSILLTEMLPGNYVKVSVADTGVGISKKAKNNIFEPFYTTKSSQKGTGLGLSMVYGIIQNHNGFIYCDSEPGLGSAFIFYLPISENEIKEIKDKESTLIKGDATVLVVDDEEYVRVLCETMLKKLGYKIILAKHGNEAIKLYQKNMKNIDLVLLDMIMPGIDGSETFNKLKKIDPDIKVVLSSGYTKEGHIEKVLKNGALGFIQKPYKIKDLSKTLANVLGI